MNSITDRSPFPLLYSAVPCSFKIAKSDNNELLLALKPIKEQYNVNFIIYRQSDHFETLYIVKNGYRSKVCNIDNKTSIATIINEVMKKV